MCFERISRFQKKTISNFFAVYDYLQRQSISTTAVGALYGMYMYTQWNEKINNMESAVGWKSCYTFQLKCADCKKA